jgi:hypothetical protein
MVQEMMADWFLHEQERRFNAPAARHKREWRAMQAVDQIASELKVERARLGEQAPTLNEVWRNLPV